MLPENILSQPMDFNDSTTKSQTSAVEPIDIVLVEDTFSDELLTRITLDTSNIPYRMVTLDKGDKVIPYLVECRHTLPDLIMLDLGLPGMDGFELFASLSEMRCTIRQIPIVVLTAYENFEYIRENYPFSIMDYLRKPLNVEKTQHILKTIQANISAHCK